MGGIDIPSFRAARLQDAHTVRRETAGHGSQRSFTKRMAEVRKILLGTPDVKDVLDPAQQADGVGGVIPSSEKVVVDEAEVKGWSDRRRPVGGVGGVIPSSENADLPTTTRSSADLTRRLIADDFLSMRPAMLRGLVLESPIASVIASTPNEKARALIQLDMINAGNEEATLDLSKELIRICQENGGDTASLLQFLTEANKRSPNPLTTRMLEELRSEVTKEAAIEFARDLGNDGLIEMAVEALSWLLLVPTGPVGAVISAGTVLHRIQQYTGSD